jgi:NADH dehydrogenase FAD-containing subunit
MHHAVAVGVGAAGVEVAGVVQTRICSSCARERFDGMRAASH